MSTVHIEHKYSKLDAQKLVESGKFRSFAHIADQIAKGTHLSYQSFLNYLNGKSTGSIKREAIELFFDEHLAEAGNE